jgi:hypothetical protein
MARAEHEQAPVPADPLEGARWEDIEIYVPGGNMQLSASDPIEQLRDALTAAVRERDEARQELAAAVAELGAARWVARVAVAEAETALAGRPARAASVVAGRLDLAVRMTQAADGKAAGLLSGAGVLAAAGAVAGATTHPRPVPALVCGAALVVALVAALAVLIPRGGSPAAWLPACDQDSELARVTTIVVTKHRLLQIAVIALTTSVLAGAGAVALAALR